MKGCESMKSTMTETKFLIFTVSAIVLLMLVRIFQPELNTIYEPNNYVGIHTVLEVLCIAISVTIFLYGLKYYRSSRSSRMLFLAFTFFIVGMVDILHMISFKGMPALITESSVAKATWFWVIARVIQSLFLLVLLLLPDWRLKRDYWPLFLVTGLLLSGGIGALVILFEGNLPMLVIEGKGTTVLKNIIEYFVSLILFISLIITLYHYYLEKSEEKLYFALAMVFFLLTELIFTIYQSVFDLDNFLGHVFKVFGFYFILKSFYFSKMATVVERKNAIALPDQPGMFFSLKKRGNEFICLDIKGELLQTIGYHQDEIIGRPLTEVFLPMDASINDYCYLAQKLKETVTFEMDCMEKSLLISIKTSFNEENQDVILGTVIDMTGVLQQKLSHKNMNNEDKNVRVVM
ncbi:MASE3 domain-containing protein [Neobacillus sp. FSL H8-0543]|uniref:MASE3 domain-containing protein n=1 Tax=Neobacillus sp. FSL H8-0543 TaxID=2954672 RepID=UPI003158B399